MRNIAILTTIALCVWMGYLFISFTGLFDGDAMEYAEIGRNILRGKGFYTNSLYTIRLPFSHKAPFPSLRRPPFLPLLLAGSFSLFGVSDLSVVFVTGLFFILTIPVIYVLSLKMFDRKDVAILTSLFYTFNNCAIFYSANGLAEPICYSLLCRA